MANKQQLSTIIETGPCVSQPRLKPKTLMVTVLQLGFGDKKEKPPQKAEINHFSKSQSAQKAS